jgi:hypothetical protein
MSTIRMAKRRNQKQRNDSGRNFEAQLWAAADKMRDEMDASESMKFMWQREGSAMVALILLFLDIADI